MKISKTIIFIVIAFIVIISITFITRPAVAPVMTVETPMSSATYTLVQVAEHGVETDCWTAVKSEVFNLTPFIKEHPGGIPNISRICGKDGTEIFGTQHGDQKGPLGQLAKLKIGIIK